MFAPPRYLQNSFSIIFPRQPYIRRLANEIEDKLKENPDLTYSQPQVISVPDELDPEIPRLIFNSQRGSSQIVISQVSIALNVIYTPDWQLDISKGRKYLIKRVSALFDVLNILNEVRPCFAGLTTIVRIPTKAEDIDIIKHIYNNFLKENKLEHIHDVQIKITTTLDSFYYSNLTIHNYRTWDMGESPPVRMPNNKATDRGIQIIGDFNDRYAFNENEGYFTTKEASDQIIDKGFREIESIIKKIRGVFS